MNRKTSVVIALAALLLSAGTLTITSPAYGSGQKEKAEMAAAAKVTIDQAAKTATEKSGGKVIEAELEKKHGKVIWEVKTVGTDGKVHETDIDAESGTVIEHKAIEHKTKG